MRVNFQLIFILFTLLITGGCSGEPETPEKENNFPSDSIAISENNDPVLPDESGIARESFQPDTFRYFGYDYEGDTVIYEKNGEIIHEGTLNAKFVAVLRADYLHLVVRDSLGRAHAFWLWLEDTKQMDNFYEGNVPEVGQKIRVNWKRENTFIEEADDYMVLYKAVSIQLHPD